MLSHPWHTERFDAHTANEANYAALTDFENHLLSEMMPDDPPISLDERRQGFQNLPSFVEVQRWVVWEPTHTAIIGRANALLYRTETNQHVVEFNIGVLPAYRQQGLGRALLAQIVHLAQAEKRSLLIAETSDRVPAGKAFMNLLGAEQGLTAHINQLELACLDGQLLDQWQHRAAERAADFELGLWTNPYPQDQLDAIVRLLDVMNSEPREQLEVEDIHLTAQDLRQIEQFHASTGTERWTIYVRERNSGKLAGFTEVQWNRNRPQIVQQKGTGVFPEYRNKGLGRWLKGAMMEKILRELPQARWVRTGNADSNAAMLKINHELGFRAYRAITVWQVETQRVATQLDQT